MANGNRKLAGAALALGCGGCCVGGIALAVLGTWLGGRVEGLELACDGHAVPGAAEHRVGAPGPHPATVYQRGSTGWSIEYGALRPGWSSDQTATTELVVCIEPEQERELQPCLWHDGSTTGRVQFERPVRVVAARTGAVVLSTTAVGGAPIACPEIAMVTGGRYEGTHVDDTSWAWLETIVAPIIP